jgi:uncharacterized protein
MSADQIIIGRKSELETLERCYQSNKSEFLILYGRRRVGKTFLVAQKFGELFTFRMTAQGNVDLKQQLKNFHTVFKAAAPQLVPETQPESWFDAFQLLIELVKQSPQERKIIFIDELPWFDTYSSDFLSALEHFWNSWAAMRHDVLLIGCGSAASWMISELINNRGGLHNRVTERIILQPFTLAETEQFLQAKGADFDRYQLLELYMTMGGIPFYLDAVLPNRSVDQNIDRLFFTPGGLLNTEYSNLYRSLFNRHERHVAVVEALAHKSMGLTRPELLKQAKIKDGGTATLILNELVQSGFIKKYYLLGKAKRHVVYQLIDPYSLFYLNFVKDSKAEGQGAWLSQMNSARWNAWSGYAFENICRYHIDAIKRKLGITGVYAEISAWRSKQSSPGAQIDLVIDRNDRVINLCEIKFSDKTYSISADYALKLRNKMEVFRTETKTKKTIFLTMICANGLHENENSRPLVRDWMDLEALFAPTGFY